MSTTSFRVHLSEQHVVDEELDDDKPVYLVVSGLVSHYGLPTGEYSLFAGPQRQRISRELRLRETPYANGGDIYLALARSPWWAPLPVVKPAPSAVGAKRPKTYSMPSRPSITPRHALLAVLALLAISLLLGMIFWPSSPSSVASNGQAVSLVAPTTAVTEPTATLLPASPTPDLATQVRTNYQNGMTAYAAEDWATAVSYFQLVYSYDANYSEVRSSLAASYYNWGVYLRDRNDVGEAKAHFQATLEIDPNHSLAQGELEKASIFLEAQAAASNGDHGGALERYRRVNTLHGSDYAGANAQIYEMLIVQANVLRQEGGAANLRQAYNLYSEAANLGVGDSSYAQQSMLEVQQMLPTPTPVPTAVPTPRPTAVPEPARLRFSVANYNDDPHCISIGINGIVPAGWFFVVDGMGHVSGRFDGGGNARACGLGYGQEVTLTVFDGNGSRVLGGGGIPSRGSAIMVATWR
ncbi:tetratricopeptide repeat protein [Candidatus Viridilinea mediisalina]|uniref:Uncharacterized protein n=1 Tax=Candidatus Viridilinea mediisalina TaxID=2024553 RepID=A0A2A6RHJ8_9CHLR|nr:tetratricopeptide repeat protein [Candidatus Viridilinea mediisalina]PDW02320.1 hypothetical protein CJ255_14635 [Candidatus Viridilinea mediisalina]